ncbi:MAG: hypothetical protein ACE5OW_03655 [Candidatus Bathyarchaeia archaeon]
MALGKGIGMWISGFLAFLAGLDALNAIILLNTKGVDAIFKPYLIGYVTGEMQVMEYFWASIIVTSIFLGLTSIIACQGPSPLQVMLETIAEVEEKIATNKKVIEKIRTEVEAKLAYDKIARLNEAKTIFSPLIEAVNANIDKTRKEVLVEIQKIGDLSKGGAMSTEEKLRGHGFSKKVARNIVRFYGCDE